MLGYLLADIICSEKPTVFRKRNCEFRGAGNIQGQISEHSRQKEAIVLYSDFD